MKKALTTYAVAVTAGTALLIGTAGTHQPVFRGGTASTGNADVGVAGGAAGGVIGSRRPVNTLAGGKGGVTGGDDVRRYPGQLASARRHGMRRCLRRTRFCVVSSPSNRPSALRGQIQQ